jgi:hypothetical protein
VKEASKYLGQCACGDIRFTIVSEPLNSNYCHCSICRKHTGAPILLGAKFHRDDVRVEGEWTEWRSSDDGVRCFCGRCGSSLFYRFESMPELLEVMVGVINDARGIDPKFHLFVEQQIPWFNVKDELPRYATIKSIKTTV